MCLTFTDSAYFFVEQQVLFGPRVPNSNAHNECFVFLKNKLNKLGATVSTQIDYVERFDGYRMKMKNIIASYNPNSIKRILLYVPIGIDTQPTMIQLM